MPTLDDLLAQMQRIEAAMQVIAATQNTFGGLLVTLTEDLARLTAAADGGLSPADAQQLLVALGESAIASESAASVIGTQVAALAAVAASARP